ncbi:MAG: hypothetical protein R3Y09_03335 [Clostridia bacterium]
MAKVNETKIRRLNRFLIIAVIIVGGYTLFNMVSIQYDISQKSHSIETLNTNIGMQTHTNEELMGILDEGATDDAIIEVAQDKLGLALPGERVMADIGSK